MARPYTVIESIETSEGKLELRQRDARDFLITVGHRVLMSSTAHKSELLLGEIGCRDARHRPQAEVLIGGLGMGYTLRGALDNLGQDAKVTVVEINPVVEEWCRGPMKDLCGNVLDDPRVEVMIGDFAMAVRRADAGSYDAIVLDLYEGPNVHTDAKRDLFYSARAIGSYKAALKPKGILAVWSEQNDQGFEDRLAKGGFKAQYLRAGRGGLRHALYLAQA